MAIAHALSELPVEQRQIVVLRIWGELTFEQIAESLDTARSTVFSRYEAAMRRLRERFSETPV